MTNSSQPLFAKQPIFDTQLNVVAYELLFRSDNSNSAQHIDGDQATSHVLTYAFGQHRISDIIGDVPAYINFTSNMLMCPPDLPPENLVIEVLEDVKPDKQVLESLKGLRAQGYKIALDDFFLTKETKALITYADIIKVDVLAIPSEKLKRYVDCLRPHNIKLLAEKIETYESMELCKSLGFELFQGYFLAKPHIVKGKKIQENRETTLRLLTVLTEPEVEIKTVADVIASDPRLSYKILKIMNSSACITPCEIESITQAVSMLGIEQIKKWAMLLILANNDTKPLELCMLGMTRAKFAEKIGAAIGGEKMAEKCFTTGILSTFDAFLDLPMSELLSKLTLAPDIEQGLTNKKSAIGAVLQLTQTYETANWKEVDEQKKAPRFSAITEKDLNEYYTEALSWARSTMTQT